MLTTPSFLTPLESAVISAMLEASTEFGAALSVQLAESTLESREHNGYGFYTTFHVSDGTEPIPPPVPLIDRRFAASTVVGGQLCGFLLWILNGKIDFLEGYPLGGDEWPSNESFGPITLDQST
ncbi:hypothetical protein HDF16_001180 [Granulicella aggregans]|uniref:Uncharacterized protein n=1 Tax=Granulicella aggregans TaxID=474949 RepID=A0A7W8E3U6_9BACT|nr:hypothetical protein [Granulicella aggregans]